MATGFGVGRDQNGNGTTTEDIQTITAAEYANPGILAGVEVTATTGMSYKINAGAVVIALDKDHYIKAPVQGQTIPTEAAPAVGERTDIVWIKQNFPSTDGNNAVVVQVGSRLPTNSIEIARYTVKAGNTATNQAVRAGNTVYARPIGATLGLLGDSVDTGGQVRAGTQYKKGSVSFFVPTDRTLELSLSSCVSTANTVEGTGSLMYKFYLDDVLVTSWERVYTKYWETKQFETGLQVQQGRHTVHYTVQRVSGPDWEVRYGGERKMRGDFLALTDRGIWKG